MKKIRSTIFAILAFTAFARAEDAGFQPEFSGDHIGGGDWLSVYTHLTEVLKLSVETVTGQPFKRAATLELTVEAPPEATGKASYFRSRPFRVDSGHFAVEWYENVVEGAVGPQFELWGEAGKKPNELSHLLIRLGRKPGSVTLDADSLAGIEPGWRHFKVVVSADKNTFDFYCDEMTKPAADGLPLAVAVDDTDHLAVGFILYVSPGTLPTKWQVGGISAQAE